MYKNYEDLFKAIQGDWNFLQYGFTNKQQRERFIKDIVNGDSEECSLADIFDDKEPNNACECLVSLKIGKNTKFKHDCLPCSKCPKFIELLEELKTVIFVKSKGGKLKAINEFMGK